MIGSNKHRLLVLHSGIFPDADTVALALEQLSDYQVEHEHVNGQAKTSLDWDRVLEKILDAEKVLTL